MHVCTIIYINQNLVFAMLKKITRRIVWILRPIGVVRNEIAVGAVGLRFDSRACGIGHSDVNG